MVFAHVTTNNIWSYSQGQNLVILIWPFQQSSLKIRQNDLNIKPWTQSPGSRLNNFKTLLSQSLTGTLLRISSPRRENCDARTRVKIGPEIRLNFYMEDLEEFARINKNKKQNKFSKGASGIFAKKILKNQTKHERISAIIFMVRKITYTEGI